jgi:hypothetical protein
MKNVNFVIVVIMLKDFNKYNNNNNNWSDAQVHVKIHYRMENFIIFPGFELGTSELDLRY